MRRASLINLSKFLYDDPSISVASIAFFFHSLAFCLAAFPFSPSIISLTSASISSRLTSSLTSTPISQVVQAYRQFVCCSAKKGQQIIGTPAHTLSNIEFQPQCVR
ncbi:hypothetical protein ACB092_02G226000 [Castanea dentata]